MNPHLDVDFAQGILKRQPFSVLLGAQITRFDTEAHVELDLRADLRQQNGFAHGGVLSYLADNSLTFAAGIPLGPDIVTSRIEIDYLRPATGRLLRAEAYVIETATSTARCECQIFDDADTNEPKLCATATGTATRLKRRSTE